MQILSYGAARTVTGSNHLVDTGSSRLLLDCGLFQGADEFDALNLAPFVYPLESIDALVLSHAHLDHAGRLPLLARRGFDRPIHALPATRALVEYLLLDSAKLMHEDAERARRRGRSQEPLYDAGDVEHVLRLFAPLAYGTTTQIAGVDVTPRPAGHIPGSAILVLDHGGRRAVFSGDIGNAGKVVLPDPTPCPEADIVLMESTYGDRDHRPFAESVHEFASVLRDAAERDGKVLIPSFALERTQDLLYHIAALERDHEIPVLPVYVDSPLASKVDRVYDAYADEFSDEVRAALRAGRDPFVPKQLRYSESVEDSKRINEERGAAIVLAGAGMLTGGRILHHLRRHLPEPSTTLVIVGFQPAGGLGRRLIDGATEVSVFGDPVSVRARVVTVNGFSAHAGRSELLAWARSAGAGADIRLVHGEVAALEALRDGIASAGQHASIQEPQVPLPATHGGREQD